MHKDCLINGVRYATHPKSPISSSSFRLSEALWIIRVSYQKLYANAKGLNALWIWHSLSELFFGSPTMGRARDNDILRLNLPMQHGSAMRG